jgi:hypothetical protein
VRRYEAPADGVTAYMWERLGNQLFVWAAALAQARRLDAPCYANLSVFHSKRPKRHYTKAFALESFDHGMTIVGDPKNHPQMFLGYPAVGPATFWHNQVQPKLPRLAQSAPVFMEASFAYDKRVDTIVAGTTMLGLFQSWRYFVSIDEEVRARMANPISPSAWFRDATKRLAPGTGSIVLNVRRGDYLMPANQRLIGLATRDYYAEALAVLRASGIDGTVYVASDSLEDAMRELKGLGDLSPIEVPAGTDPFETLVLLSRADAFVAANSSFSWWAAYLGTRPGRPVIAPRPWFTDSEVDDRDLLPGSWLTLGRDQSAFLDARGHEASASHH